MSTLITILHVCVCLFLMLTVLLQQGKSGMGGAFGGSSAGTVFGGAGASSFLRKLTAIAATIFMITSMILAYVASRDAGALQALPPMVSVLADRGDWVHRDYEKVMKDVEALSVRGRSLETDLQAREHSIATLKEEVLSLQHAHEELRDALAEREAALSRREAEVAARDEAIALRDREILRRGGLRWWLRLPFVRFGWMKAPEDKIRG